MEACARSGCAGLDRRSNNRNALSVCGDSSELRFGIAALPLSKRRETLHRRLEHDILPLFEGRVLAFDLDASQAYAALMARAKQTGRAIGTADGFIAATAAVRSFIVATRDTAPFDAAGVGTVDPWQALP